MIFVVETEERALTVFRTEGEAIARCEGVDVEADVWLFWARDGSPLEAEFTTPNKRGWFSVRSGSYRLVPASPDHHTVLSEALDEILLLEANPFFSSLSAVREYLAHPNS
ncbi:MAG: hypothetical protein V4607_17370 [Pseudomonadota bacterium]